MLSRTEFEVEQTHHGTARSVADMKSSFPFRIAPTARKSPRKIGRDAVHLVGDLLPLFDFSGILLAAWVATLLFASGVAPAAASGIWTDGARAALAAALLAPLVLCDKAFVRFASSGQTGPLIRCYVVRFLMLASVVAVIGIASRSLSQLPAVWLSLWFAISLMVTAFVRWLMVTVLRQLERSGVITESVAIVGSGALADRVIQQLKRSNGSRIEMIGVFDDRKGRRDGSLGEPDGSLADLIELGKSRPLDWIVLASPDTIDNPTQAIVQRLKALAVPIGLCPQTLSDNWAAELAARHSGWHSTRAALAAVLPAWVLTLLGIPVAVFQKQVLLPRQMRTPIAPLTLSIDDYDLDRFTDVAAGFGDRRFGYVVTPNADHLIRLHHEPSFRALYADAAYVLLDSRFISHLVQFTQNRRLPVCTGSDLTATLFKQLVVPDDRIVLIGGNAQHAEYLAQQYGLRNLAHHVPPMGFVHDELAMEACLRFIEAHSPFRYCLLAVGAPQQEIVAQRLKVRGTARGMALCIGASINFMTGDERRAPLWMQRSGLEWLFRLLQAPGRMTQRYLVRGPQLFGLLRHTEIVLRAPIAAALPAVRAPVHRSVGAVVRQAA